MVAIKCRYDSDADVLKILKESGNASEFAKKAIRHYHDYLQDNNCPHDK